MRLLRLLIAAGVASAVMSLGADARAQDDFFRSSPGALSRSHAEIDGQENCNECHDGGKATNDTKCLNCHDHKDLKARIDAREGFHASNKVRGKKCEKCHLEHKGLKFDIRGWPSIAGGEKKFDHWLTGWKLNGKHDAIDCADCHKNKNKQGLRTYLGEDKYCGSCHDEDSPHEFDRKPMKACQRCHNESAWKPQLRKMDFDHNDPDDAAMKIEGTHKDVSCGKCHPKAKFNLKKKVPDDCANCHNSPHDKHLFGLKKCSWCHSPTYGALKTYKFDHKRKAKFDLAGGHSKLECYDCHTAKLGRSKPNRACEICHSDDNIHGTRFKEFGNPPKCAFCHPERAWVPDRFNHDKRTGFPLQSKHATLDCRKCHRGKTKPFKFERFKDGMRCMSCHRHANAHDREFTDKPKGVRVKGPDGKRVQTCLECHTNGGSLEIKERGVKEVHGPKGTWPLLKKHAKVKCVQCHPGSVYRDTPVECGVRCHEDSLHKGTLGDKCSDCHRGGQWEAVRFNHNKDTEWPLVGWHKKIPKCEDCHPKREEYHKTPTNCSAKGCHAADDVHKGRLGDSCERCHLETGKNIFNHNRDADYKLDGAHLTTQCAECHPSIKFKPRPTNCNGCHPDPDIHKGRFGLRCESCHNTTAFEQFAPLHDIGNFSLKGAHDNLDCKRCHLDSRPLQGMGNLCITCHRQDDIHSNSLSPQCGECHTQWSFAPARFDHTTVGCNLTGLHKVVPCYDCHATGTFGGLSPTCYSCHVDSARRVIPNLNPGAGERLIPDHGLFVDCSNCHNPNFWVPAELANSYGKESICR